MPQKSTKPNHHTESKRHTIRRSDKNNGAETIQNLVNHFANIPIEIFIEIVKMVIRENHSSPLLISSVSKNWREVVHNIPALWDTLVLTHRRPAAKAEFWIARTRGKLKGLWVWRQAASKARTASWEPFLEQIHWEALQNLRVERWPVVDYLNRIGKVNALVSLESLEIDGKNSFDSFRSIQNSLDYSLRHLIILSAVQQSFYSSPRVGNLTTLALVNVTVTGERFCDMLSVNPLLEHLYLERVRCNGITRNLTLRHLKSLHLRNYVHIPISGLKMPALEVFLIARPNISVVHFNFLNHIVWGRSSTQLTDIVFKSYHLNYFNFHDVRSLLLISPNLQSLEITNTPSQTVASLIEFLSVPHHSSFTEALSLVCPNLTHVNFSGCSGVETGPIMRLVKSRLTIIDVDGKRFGWDGQRPAPQSQPISSLIIDFCPQIDPSWVSWLCYRVPRVSYVLTGTNSSPYEEIQQDWWKRPQRI